MTERPSLLRLHRAQVCQIPREQAVKLCRLLSASQRTWLLNKKTAKGQGLPSDSPGGPYAALPSLGLWVRGLAPFANLPSCGARSWSLSHRKSGAAPQGLPQPGVKGCAKQPASPTDGRAELPSITTVSGQLSPSVPDKWLLSCLLPSPSIHHSCQGAGWSWLLSQRILCVQSVGEGRAEHFIEVHLSSESQ